MRHALIAVLVPQLLLAQTREVPDQFDRLDRDAQKLWGVAQCAGLTSAAVQDGLFGDVGSGRFSGACLNVDGHRVGVLAELDSAQTKILKLRAIDMVRRVAPSAIDTAEVLHIMQTEATAIDRGYGRYKDADRQFVPMTFRTDGDSIEVWLVPATSMRGITAGGETGYIFAPDGKTVGRQVDAFNTLRPITIPDTGVVRFVSSEEALPTISEMYLANALNSRGRQVSIETRRRVSTLMKAGTSAIWVHVRKP